ncbi:uncharacterized [Tachysurus ichikawai]
MSALPRHSDKCVFSRRFSAKIRRCKQDPERSATCLLNRDFVLRYELASGLGEKDNVAVASTKVYGASGARSGLQRIWGDVACKN